MPTRLIDLPFSRGIDESVDATVLTPPAMTEMVNYRLTRTGRLEHRLGVSSLALSPIRDSVGDRPDGNKPQAIYGRFLAAGGHGYTALRNNRWVCAGSVPRFVPIESYPAAQTTSVSQSNPSCASVNGYLVTVTRVVAPVISQQVNVFDEVTGALVWDEQISTAGGTPNSMGRVVASGSVAVIIVQDLLTGSIEGYRLDLSTTPITGISAGTVIVGTAVATTGFDAAPSDSSSFVLSYQTAAGAAGVALVSSATFATLLSTSVTDGAGSKVTTCRVQTAALDDVYYLAWLNATTRNVCVAVFNFTMAQVGVTQTLGTAPGTGFSTDNFRPVIGSRSDTSSVVGWTDSYLSGSYETYRTTFRDVDRTAVLGATYGPTYGYALASKPFRGSTSFVETTSQPAVWLVNHNPNVTELDRSYFLMLLGTFSRDSDNAACSLEMSAAPSAAPAVTTLLGLQTQVCEVVESTTLPLARQVVFIEGFRGLGTATPQNKAQVYRFGDGSRSRRARTRCVVPCQGSFAVLGGAPRWYDTDRLIEIGISHGPTVIEATPAATGSMSPGFYQYVFVLEYFDGQGQRQLSYVSSPVGVTVGVGQAQVNFELQVPSMWAFPNTTSGGASIGRDRARGVVIRAYRTSDNGTVFRYAPDTSDPNGAYAGPLRSFGRVQYQDVNSDTAIAANEAVYVQVGNALSNYRAPPCRFGCEHEGRLVVGGLWAPNDVKVSKLFFPGEGIQFTEHPAFTITSPEPVTGCASLDGSLVLFAARSIYVVNGDGPTDDGAGSFSTPRCLPGRIGCIDWRSIVTTGDGVFFRSLEGLHLLPRGLAAPVFVGAPVKEKFREYPETLGAAVVTRAVASTVDEHDSEQVACWLLGNAETATAVKILTFSLTTKTWAEIDLPESEGNLQNVIGIWSDLTNGTDVIGWARQELNSAVEGSVLVEAPGSGYDRDVSSSFEPLLNGSWRTGKVFPFGFGGRGAVHKVRIVGECLAPTTLTPTVYTDVDEAGYTGTTWTFTAGRFSKELELRRKDLAWLQIAVSDPTTGSGNRGAGLRFNGIVLEVEMEPGLHRSLPTDRSI